MKELYWLAEELQSYTHLTGDRFDIESAYRRLWPMKPHIATISDADVQKKVQEYYNEMDEILDLPMCFDKQQFEKTIDALVVLLEAKQKS